jgi:hypothetical protein
MAYTVYNNDGSVLVNISNGEIDDLTTSLSLIGKNVNNYGEIINNNFVKLLTSFANTFDKEPSNPQVGQLFYDKTQNKLKVYDGTKFSPQLQPYVDGSGPTAPAEGDLWFDTNTKQLKVYNNGWNTVGPQVSFIEGKFGVTPPTTSTYNLTDGSGNAQNVGIVYSRSIPYLLLVENNFTADVQTSLRYFNTSVSVVVNSGTTVLNTLTVAKDLKVTGDIFVQGNTLTPYRGFTAAYNSGWLGAFTATYTATNNFVRLELLPYLFSTSSTITNLLSEVKVALTSGTFTATEVRHYRLEERVTGVRAWEAYEKYSKTADYNNIVSTWTNVVRLA